MRTNRSGKMIVMIAIVLAVLLVAAGVGAFMLKSHGGKAGKKDKGPVSTLALGEFVVNLADQGEVRYLKTNVVLEVVGAQAAGGHGEEGSSNAKVRDAVIEVMSSKRFAELTKPGGKNALKKDIMKAVGERLEGAEVVGVYFNEFAMQ